MGSRDTVLFYGFTDKQDMISELMDGEIAAHFIGITPPI